MTNNTIATLPPDQLRPNDYNPNRMNEEAFAEFLAEVRHLGRLPKPIVVRPNGEGYCIVDGEHGWRAASEIGLDVVPCEIIDVDDFEAMRQTYKRNRHGADETVALGRMFRRMMEAHTLSQRALVKEIEVSEGTVRNALLYAEATDLRNRYALEAEHSTDDVGSTISALSVQQVRHYVKLPRPIADLWLNTGGSQRALWEALHPGLKDDVTILDAQCPGASADLHDTYQSLVKTDLIEFLRPVSSASGFIKAIRTLCGWIQWERQYCFKGLGRADLRPYTRQYFAGEWVVREKYLMDEALDTLIDTATDSPSFRLTPEEFEAVITTAKHQTSDTSALMFFDRLRLAIHEKMGRLPDDEGTVRWRLSEAELEADAPDYIRSSHLSIDEKYALWKAAGWNDLMQAEAPDITLEAAKQGLAASSHVARRHKESLDDAIRRHLHECWREQRLEQKLTSMTKGQLAQEIAGRMPIYRTEEDRAAQDTLAEKLTALTTEELVCLHHYSNRLEYEERTAAMLRAISGR